MASRCSRRARFRVRRFFDPSATSARLLVLALTCGLGCQAQYVGISASRPTGSAFISAIGLAASYDIESLTADGHLRDFSGNGNNGTFTRNQLVDGLFGKARHFSSVEDRVSLASNPTFDIRGPLSIAAWVKVGTLGLHQHIVAWDNRFAFWFTPDDQLRFVDTLADGLMTNWRVGRDRWYSLIGVFEGTEGDDLTQSNIRMYVDGQAVSGNVQGRGVWGKGPLFPTDACSIGFESHQGLANHKALLFSGDIDELLIFNRALTEPEVRTHAKH
jgi:hypothetical protein